MTIIDTIDIMGHPFIQCIHNTTIEITKDNYLTKKGTCILGIKASKAGRLTAASFLRLSKEGLTLEDAMNQVNEAQKKGVTETELLALSTKLFGVNSAAVGIILSSNRDKMAELTTEFERANGTLKDLTDIQLTSLSAKMDLLNSSWEKFIFSIENGQGAISNAFKKTIIEIGRASCRERV